ncbi:26S proteasome non-ATPase regulatory subunit 9 [Chenopodium quinoa]|uniref:26S proteasome non-ATPase regulatory subunit 9 n=1 Tax=Chenopodium quinoa TaxID=63459 RepID=UPI000B77FECD|nr:26S proteasome non-ATPase regulatory subunit 9 [Chenopodium quinoa]
MVGTNLKAETTSLMDERDATESEINAIIHRLCQDGGPGLSANLVDSEGFPRADINIPAVRADRQRLAELRIDHINLTEKISQNIQLLHATKLGPKVSTTMDSDDVDMSNTVGPANADTTSGIPFAMVDEIAEASPAAEDGLQLGDQMVKFGSVESGDDLLPRLASEVQKNQGTATSVVVMRQGVLTSLYITPRTWEGSGLLGCHFKFL